MTQFDLDDLKSRNPIVEVAARYTKLAKAGARFAGPCPICGGSARNRRFECDPVKGSWVCAVCSDGGDVIRLVEKIEGCTFKEAVERLGGARAIDPQTAERLAKQQKARAEEREKEAELYRAREIKAAQAMLRWGRKIGNTATEAYLVGRGIAPRLGAQLLHVDNLPYYDDGKMIYSGPAMLAAIRRDCEITGIHMTWIDPARPGKKQIIRHPDTGEVLPSKKVRGSKTGGVIFLVPTPTNVVRVESQVVIGEGIETVLSVATALGPDHYAYYVSSVDLGNLGGAALGTMARAEGLKGRVPNGEPDLTKRGILMPDFVTEILMLGDGDSERLLTENAMKRAAKRWAKPGRVIRCAWADEGKDFNDMLIAEKVA